MKSGFLYVRRFGVIRFFIFKHARALLDQLETHTEIPKGKAWVVRTMFFHACKRVLRIAIMKNKSKDLFIVVILNDKFRP